MINPKDYIKPEPGKVQSIFARYTPDNAGKPSPATLVFKPEFLALMRALNILSRSVDFGSTQTAIY